MRFTFLFFLITTCLVNGQRSEFNQIDFKKADSIALVHKGENLKNLPVLTHNLTNDLSTDVERFRAIYTWVGTNIENDYGAYLRTSKKRKKFAKDHEAFLEWNNSFTPKVFEKLIAQRKTACSGYAYLIREMASLAGFNCKIIDGYGRTPTLLLNSKSTPNHSWNAIEIDGKWYLCDATWSAGRIVIEDGEPQFQSEYFDGYFLANPELFVKNHFPLQKKWTLVTNSPSLHEFIEGPVVYKEAFHLNIIPTFPTRMHIETKKHEIVLFTIDTSAVIATDDIVLELYSGGTKRIVKPKISRNQDNLVLEYIFEKSGSYDVHIKLGDGYIATYVVRVKQK